MPGFQHNLSWDVPTPDNVDQTCDVLHPTLACPPHFSAIRLDIARGQTLAEKYQHKMKLVMQQWSWTELNYTKKAPI